MAQRKLVYMPVDDVLEADRNPKGHAEQVIASSIDRFGFVEIPVLDDRTGKLVGGHGRLYDVQRRREAGEKPPEGVVVKAGVWTMPVVRGYSSRSDEEAHALGIALNRAGEKGGWKTDELFDMLTEFEQASTDDVDLMLGLGFDSSDLDQMRAEIEARTMERDTTGGGHVDKRRVSVPEPGSEVTERGDVWILGEHRVMCGDCRDAADVARLFVDDRIAVAFTSPPYADRRDYDETSGFKPIPPDEYVDWYAPVAANIAAHLADDGSSFVNIKAQVTPDGLDTELYVLDLVIAHAREWGWHFVTEFCWERAGVPRNVTRRFKNQFEPIFHFARGDRWKMRPDHVRMPSDSVPKAGRPDDVEGADEWQADWTQTQGGEGESIFEAKARAGWSGPGLAYPGNRLPTFAGSHEATGHAAAFPVGLPAWFVRAYTDPGDVVYDPFVGSGSTLLAAAQESRRGRGMELSRGYVDVVCARWQLATGDVPVRESTGEPVDVLASMTVVDEPVPVDA